MLDFASSKAKNCRNVNAPATMSTAVMSAAANTLRSDIRSLLQRYWKSRALYLFGPRDLTYEAALSINGSAFDPRSQSLAAMLPITKARQTGPASDCRMTAKRL